MHLLVCRKLLERLLLIERSHHRLVFVFETVNFEFCFRFNSVLLFQQKHFAIQISSTSHIPPSGVLTLRVSHLPRTGGLTMASGGLIVSGEKKNTCFDLDVLPGPARYSKFLSLRTFHFIWWCFHCIWWWHSIQIKEEKLRNDEGLAKVLTQNSVCSTRFGIFFPTNKRAILQQPRLPQP